MGRGNSSWVERRTALQQLGWELKHPACEVVLYHASPLEKLGCVGQPSRPQGLTGSECRTQ